MKDDHRALEQRLRDTYQLEPPAALQQRLLEIPGRLPRPSVSAEADRRRAQRRGWFAALQWPLAAPAAAVIAALAIVWTAGLWQSSAERAANEDAAARIAQEQAVRDFIIVMEYLNVSTARANAAVQGELGAGLLVALERGEQSFRDTSIRVTNGG